VAFPEISFLFFTFEPGDLLRGFDRPSSLSCSCLLQI
jgi:hypothetical protein